ncbi:MAG TPA: hypothetical protein PLE73_06320 [Spirochaetota bacterium]|nr:hypothetical protein [Spirochaetota bacterium]HPI22794.1 hypothetical protein [Spirochaetota bacterium]HPU87845.1 hypothetical protein [Spirochaetota bacterium]
MNSVARMTRGVAAAVAVVCMAGCASGNRAADDQRASLGDAAVKALVQRVRDLNAGAPDRFVASFTVEGTMHNRKNFKSLGSAMFLRDPLRMKVIFTDLIFKSPISMLVRNGDELRFYFPAERKLVIDSAAKIDLNRYIEIDVDFLFLSQIASGRVGTIENFKASGGADATGDPKAAGTTYLILENDRFYQTIAFRNNLPEKILLVRKSNNHRFEFHFEAPAYQNNRFTCRSIRFISLARKDVIRLTFNRINYNVAIDPDGVTDIPMDRKTETIRVN